MSAKSVLSDCNLGKSCRESADIKKGALDNLEGLD